MFICGICKEQSQPREKATSIVTETWPESGQIKREVKACSACAEIFNIQQDLKGVNGEQEKI